MPGLSRDTAPQVLETESMVIRSGPLGDHVAAFERFDEETRTDGLFDGLPGDRCSCPHWGYVYGLDHVPLRRPRGDVRGG